MTATLAKLGATCVVGVVGLSMIFWGVERSSLVDEARRRGESTDGIPPHIYITLFVGLVLLNISVFLALTVWSSFLKANPDTRQVPVWTLISVIVVAGGIGITGLAQHAGYVRSLDAVPMEVNQGFIAFEVIAASFVVGALVIMGVRWAPGYRPRVLRER